MHGISQIKLFTELTNEDIDNMINVNLKSVFYVTREAIKSMIKNQEGSIVNISSVWGTVGGACEVHYSATKAGIIGMTKALAKEVALSNIRVNAVAPGAIDTDMNSDLTKEELQELEKEILLGRIGRTEDIANCVYMLIQNSYITGQVITVDGGWIG